MTRGLWSAHARMSFEAGYAVPGVDCPRRRRLAAEDLELVASVLGLPEAQLANELDDRSAADVALDHGVGNQPSLLTRFLRGLCVGSLGPLSPAGSPLTTDSRCFLGLPVAPCRGCTLNRCEDYACTSRDS